MLIEVVRYLHTCILLYRPVFAYFFASEESNHSGDDSGLQKSLFLQSSTTCVNAAQELVDVIHRNIRELLPAWWYNMFCKLYGLYLGNVFLTIVY